LCFWDPEEKKELEIKFAVTSQKSKFANTLSKETTAMNSKENSHQQFFKQFIIPRHDVSSKYQ